MGFGYKYIVLIFSFISEAFFTLSAQYLSCWVWIRVENKNVERYWRLREDNAELKYIVIRLIEHKIMENLLKLLQGLKEREEMKIWEVGLKSTKPSLKFKNSKFRK